MDILPVAEGQVAEDNGQETDEAPVAGPVMTPGKLGAWRQGNPSLQLSLNQTCVAKRFNGRDAGVKGSDGEAS